MKWVWLVNPAINGVHRVPDQPAVIDSFVGRDWVATDIPGEFNSDDEEFAAALAKWQADREKANEVTTKAKPATKSKKEDE